MNLTVRDVARLLEVSEKMIYRWVKEKNLPCYRIDEQHRFNRAEVLEWATSRRLNVNLELLREPERQPQPLPTLLDSLEAGGIHYRVGGGTEKPGIAPKEAALRAVVESLRLPEELDRASLLQVLLAREALGSTGVGDGIAIPHPRNPIVLHVPCPAITLCFLERPVDFGAVDGQPVGIFFVLVSPTVQVHLRLLSRLAFALRDSGFKSVLTRQASAEEILAEVRRIEEGLAQAAAASSR